MKRGWEYYTGGYVRGLNVESKARVTAKVLGSEAYQVRIDLASFSASYCDCPYGSYCKHMAAVLFECCELAGLQPKDLLDAVPMPTITKGMVQTSKDRPKAQPTLLLRVEPLESETPLQWQAYWESQYTHLLLREMYVVDSFIQEAQQKFIPIAAEWSPVIRAFYELHVQLFLMKKVDEQYANIRSGYYHYYGSSAGFQRISKQRLERIAQCIDVIEESSQKERYAIHFKDTADFLAKHAFPEPEASGMVWLDVYRLLWWSLLQDMAAREQELNRLHELLQGKVRSVGLRDSWRVAVAHFDIIRGRDEAAMAWLEREMEDLDPGLWFGYLQTFSRGREGDRMLAWLRWLKPYIRRSEVSYVSSYLQFWKAALELQSEDVQVEWMDVAVGLLPESYDMYAPYLLDEGRYQRWVDLNICMDYAPRDLDRSDLKMVEASEPRALLPLYHLAVERYIQEKNRDSYKQAVRLMKKLNTLYKKLKQQDRWERYIGHVSKQYSRLRALQEELRKGKLIA